MPSVEYRIPLVKKLTTGLFVDFLFVNRQGSFISFNNAPWAVGGEIIFHGKNEEFGSAQIAYGSEGIRARVKIGVFVDRNDRWRWP